MRDTPHEIRSESPDDGRGGRSQAPAGGSSASPHLTPVDAHYLVASLPAEHRSRLAHALACPYCSEHLRAVLGFGRPAGSEPLYGRSARLPTFSELWERFKIRLAAAPPSVAQICLLLEESYAAAETDRQRAYELAQLAATVIAKLDLASTPVSLAADLNAFAWTLLGHTARLRGALQAAETFFQNAQRRLALSVDPVAAAAFCRLFAVLRLDQSRQEEAAALAGRAAALAIEVALPAPLSDDPASSPEN